MVIKFGFVLAMGCQQKIASQIVAQGADYVLCLKENQPTLFEDVKSIFNLGEERQFKKILNSRKLEKIKDHAVLKREDIL
jgi:hypothetical protein